MTGELIDTTEMYLRIIFELEEEGIPPLRARIAERLGQSGPTVSQTVARMERDGLVRVATDRRLDLTDLGRQRAVRVMRKHRLAERLLVDIIGLDWELVHEEACRWEHVMSEAVERRIVAILDNPRESPYGNPIPGLDELMRGADSDPAVTAEDILPTVVDVTATTSEAVPVRLLRIGEPLQCDVALMAQLSRDGLHPGATFKVSRDGSAYVFEGARTAPICLPSDVSSQLFVTKL